jgi:hypothetical protein
MLRPLLAVPALVIALAGCAPSAAPDAEAAPVLANPSATGKERVEAFFGAVQSGDPAAVEALMAPAGRVVRANGDVIDRAAYLTDLPVVSGFEIHDVSAHQSGDVLVVSYWVSTDEVVDGAQQPTTTAPRLSVFQWQDGAWRLLAHANFNAINR